MKTKINQNISRRSFVVGGSAAALTAGLAGGGLFTLSGCSNTKTKSGINPADFESKGIYTFNSGINKGDISTAEVPTKLYTITNKNGMELCVTNVGARIVSIMVPDRDGNFKNVVLGFNNLKDYVDYNNNPKNFYGAVVGRFVNRIAKGQFLLDGKQYQVDVNEAPNLLHGGSLGWMYHTYDVEEFNEKNSIKLKLVSPDGDMGFPGEVTLYVTYTLNDDNVISMLYEATTNAPTVLNISNHSYWSLSGDVNSPITNDYLFIPSKKTTLINSEIIPTGEIADIKENGAFDFFCSGVPSEGGGKVYGKKIGRDLNLDDLQTIYGENPSQSAKDALIAKAQSPEDLQLVYGMGYDHNFCLMESAEAKAAGMNLDSSFKITEKGTEELSKQARMAAKLYSDVSGITMTILTTEPGIQFCDGFDLKGTLANIDGKKITKYGSAALEPQHYPDWPNHENFPSNYLRPGQTYKSKSEYIFTV